MITLTQHEYDELIQHDKKTLCGFDLWLLTKCAAEGFQIVSGNLMNRYWTRNIMEEVYFGLIEKLPTINPDNLTGQCFALDVDKLQEYTEEMVARSLLPIDSLRLMLNMDDPFDYQVSQDKIEHSSFSKFFLIHLQKKYKELDSSLNDYLIHLVSQIKVNDDDVGTTQNKINSINVLLKLLPIENSKPTISDYLNSIQTVLIKLTEKSSENPKSIRDILMEYRTDGAMKFFGNKSEGARLIDTIEKIIGIQLPSDIALHFIAPQTNWLLDFGARWKNV